MNAAGSRWGERLSQGWSLLRTRPNVAVFAAGLAIFLIGLISLIGDQLETPSTARLPAEQGASPPAPASRVGPTFGESVDAYIARRRAVTSDRAAKVPQEVTFGLVVFDYYRSASEVDALLRSHALEAVSILTRIPVVGFEPSEVPLDGRSIMEAARAERATLSRDLEKLEQVVGQVDSPEFNAVYRRDLHLLHEGLERLDDDPATLYAVVVKGTNQQMGRIATSEEVRYVDLPDIPSDTPQDTRFVALLPEDTEVSSVGPLPDAPRAP